jgi:hypothetical protein
MAARPEKRSENRQICSAAVEWAYFNKPDVFKAQLLNFSGGGGYIECTQPLITGATILIRLQACTSPGGDSAYRNLRTTALGEVKWCRELQAEQPYRFGVGLRYHIPV